MNFAALEIMLIAVIYVIITVVIQQRFSNVKRIKEISKEVKEHQKHLKEHGKTMSESEMKEKQKLMMDLTAEMSRHQLRASLIILPVSVVLFYYILPFLFSGQHPTVTIFSYTLSYTSFFILFAVLLGLLSQALIAEYDRIMAQKAAKITNNA